MSIPIYVCKVDCNDKYIAPWLPDAPGNLATLVCLRTREHPAQHACLTHKHSTLIELVGMDDAQVRNNQGSPPCLSGFVRNTPTCLHYLPASLPTSTLPCFLSWELPATHTGCGGGTLRTPGHVQEAGCRLALPHHPIWTASGQTSLY